MENSRKNFYLDLLKIGLPMAIQNLIMGLFNIVDTLMVGQLGKFETAAVGLSAKIFMIYFVSAYGIIAATSMFTSQHWGKKDVQSIRNISFVGTFVVFVYSTILMLILLIFPDFILSIFTKDTDIIRLAKPYIQINAIALPLIALDMSYSAVAKSTSKTVPPMITTSIAFGLNTILNYLLIFGNLGFPKLGVNGAAIATTVSRIIGCIIILTVIYGKKYPAAIERKDISFSKHLFSLFFRKMIPILTNELLWVLGVTVYSIIYARMGVNELAVISMISPIEGIAVGLCLAVGYSSGIILGNELGKNNLDGAYIYAKRFLKFGFIFAIVIGSIVIMVGMPILDLYNVEDKIKGLAKTIIYITGFTLWLRMLPMILFLGVLRSGGDVKFAFMIDTGVSWTIGIPLAFLFGIILKLPLYVVYSTFFLEEFIKFIISFLRMKSKKWLKNLTFH